MTRAAALPKRKTITLAELTAMTKRGRIRGVAQKADRTYAGRVFHSKAEAKQAAELDLLVKCGEVVAWEPQVPLPIRVRGEYICTVIVDFKVYPLKSDPYFIEVKGMETEVYKLKRKLLRACYPGLDYRVVKA